MLAYTLLHNVWTLPELPSGPPGHIQARKALCIFGSMCYHLLVPYICVDLCYMSMAHIARLEQDQGDGCLGAGISSELRVVASCGGCNASLSIVQRG
jgi:hypothetical protein